MKRILAIICLLFLFTQYIVAQFVVSEIKSAGSFPIVANNKATPVYIDSTDFSVVQKAATMLQTDIETVTGVRPVQLSDATSSDIVIIIGSLGKSVIIDRLVKEKKIQVDGIKNKWESYQIQVVQQPLKNIKTALVITGSDRRGTAYGVLELSKQIGVSPWHWWADVPATKRTQIYLHVTALATDAPKVKYRGIFINDEAPALSGWTKEKFGGFTHLFYEKVFELILRLKGNYLWPAYTYWQQPQRQRMPEVKYVPDDSVVSQSVIKTVTQSIQKTGHGIDRKTLSGKSTRPDQTKSKQPVFYEDSGYISIEANHFSRVFNAKGINWKVLPDHGKTGSAVTTFPVTVAIETLTAGPPHLEYDIYLSDTGIAKLSIYFSPTLNFQNAPEGLQYAVSVDNEEPQLISLNKEDNVVRTWESWVANNIIIKISNHKIITSGRHIIKYWMVDPGVVIQKLVLDMGGVKPGYLGPSETEYK